MLCFSYEHEYFGIRKIWYAMVFETNKISERLYKDFVFVDFCEIIFIWQKIISGRTKIFWVHGDFSSVRRIFFGYFHEHRNFHLTLKTIFYALGGVCE